MFELNSIKSTLSLHAFTSSILMQLNRETLQKQLEFLMQTNIFSNGIFKPYTYDEHLLHFQLLNIAILIITWYGCQKYNLPSSKLYKLKKFKYYKEIQNKIKFVILITIFIFFRNIETVF